MVEVVGKDSSIQKQATCLKCGNMLRYWPNEVQERTVRDYGGGSDLYRYITCPCSNQVGVR